MKFLCSHCKAKYQIADEKVAGRTLRMTCRNCKQEIVIHGDGNVGIAPMAAVPYSGSGVVIMPQTPVPAAPSPLGATFQMQVGAPLRAAPTMPVPIDEWHLGINDVPVGPMRRDEIARKLATGRIGPDTLAWREGLDDWMPLRNIPELAVLCAPAMPVAAPAVGRRITTEARGVPPPPPRAEPLAIGGRRGRGPRPSSPVHA